MHVPISRIHLIGYLVEDGITSSVHAKHTFSRTSIMLRFFVSDYARSGRSSVMTIFPTEILVNNEARPRDRSDRGRFFPLGQKASSYRIYGSGRAWANACDVFPRMPSRVGSGRRAAVDFVVCFRWGGFFFRFLFSKFFFLRTHTACCKYEATLPHLPLY